MKLQIDSYNSHDTLEFNIPDLGIIDDIYFRLERRNHSFEFLIFRNFILFDERKRLKYYKINDNDKIWFGNIGNYLNEDDIIVELFIATCNGDLIYLIMKKTDPISKLKFIISTIISNISNIWSRNGYKLHDDQPVTDIDIYDNYFKLIIGVDCENNFKNCCKIHDEYLINYLLWDVLQLDFWSSNQDYSIKYLRREWLKDNIKKQKILLNKEDFDALILHQDDSDNEKYNDKLDEIAVNKFIELITKQKIFYQELDFNLPFSFVNSRFIFCIQMRNIIDDVFDLCGDLFHLDLYNVNDLLLNKTIYDPFRKSIQVAMITYINDKRYHDSFEDIPIRNILHDVMDYFEKEFINSYDNFGYLFELFIDAFLFRSYTSYDVDEIMPGDRVKIEISIKGEFHKIFSRNLRSILDAKKEISYMTGMPVQQFHCIDIEGSEKLNDDEKFDIDKYRIEFVLNMDDIELIKNLAQGAFGDVYLCRNNSTMNQFVLKVSRKNSHGLCRDINIQRRIKYSRSLLNFFQLYNFKGQISIAMKYFSRGSLRSYIENNKISENQIAKWCHQILIQISELHEEEIIHRDIKSDNIVLDEENNAHLVDFGYSKYINNVSDEVLMSSLSVYKPGTAQYMAPEIINSEKYTNKIDIWSFGASVIEMVTGKRPYSHVTTMQAVLIISKIKKIEYEPILPISLELKDFIDLCLHPIANQRYSADELIESDFVKKFSR